jgi:precorrin-2/cobalt-factor-2 C20-methyltransferase
MSPIGTLYGIGVGPGDPELLTLKAARVLREVDVVFASAQEKSGRSLALEIASTHLGPSAEVIHLAFAHTFEGVASGEAHRGNAARVLEVLQRPASAAFLTLGDPMTYSTFTYLLSALRRLEPAVPCRVIPGITSFAAVAAEALEPLAEGDEAFAVVSAAKGTGKLGAVLRAVDNAVVMKAYRNIGAVCDLLDREGMGEDSVFSTNCSQPDQRLVRGTAAVRGLDRSYMSLFLAKRGGRGPGGEGE